MKALICEFTNLDEIACSRTSANNNRIVPSNVLYRSSIIGALLQAQLFVDGYNYADEFNNALVNIQDLLPSDKTLSALKRWYKELVKVLPKVAVSDALITRESEILRENFNCIYFNSCTALGSLKNSRVQLSMTDYQTVRDRQGRVRLKSRSRTQNLGLNALDFTVLRPDPKEGIVFPSIREVMTARVGNDAHTFRAPGAYWRVAFVGETTALQKILTLFKVVLTDLGLGAKHAFRGKGELLEEPTWVEVSPITGEQRGLLWHPLICRNGNLTLTLESCELEACDGMDLTLRYNDLTPQTRVVPAVQGEFKAARGFWFDFKGQSYILTDEDMKWPHALD